MSKVPSFFDNYGISLVDLSELIHVDVKTFRKYLDGEEVANNSREKIELALAILDTDIFQFTPPPKATFNDHAVDCTLKMARYDEIESQKKEFLRIFNFWKE